jgi:acetylornithine deacetylase/succinyl-diaminopimelate desuccinylase-like protein
LIQTRELLSAALKSAQRSRDADLADLSEELRFRSISTLPEHRPDCIRTAQWLQARFRRLGMECRLVDPGPPGLPIVVADWTHPGLTKHLTIYGHYDVQPVDPLDEWETPPFEPVIVDGEIVGRGAADNKGNHMAAMKAVEHYFAAGGPPLNLRFLIEGEEEMLGDSLSKFVRANASNLKTDGVLVWDGHFREDGRPPLMTALRGLLYVELRARGAAVDLHSGVFGGVAPNPANTLARIIAGLKDDGGHITIPGFYDAVESPTEAELDDWRAFDADYAADLIKMSGSDVLEGESGFMALERTGSRPTLDVNGLIGGFTGPGKKTVIPAQASAKVSMRLVPHQDWREIFKALQTIVGSLTTPGVKVDIDLLGATPPLRTDTTLPIARALATGYEQAFGKPVALVRSGGSIPVATDFQEALGAPVVVSGIAQADAAIHSPNEHLHIDQFHRGIEALIRFMAAFSEAHH